MFTSLKRLAYAGIFLLPFAAAPLQAQVTPIVTSPTAEGTTITNTASAAYSDANGNSYTPVTGSVTVMVGFLAAPNPSGVASVSPASPSTGNTISFTITNSGNGLDSVRVSSVTAPGVTITDYLYNGTSYGTLAALNAHLDTINIVAGAALPFPVVVQYTVPNTAGGQTIPMTIVVASMRSPTVSYNWITTITPPAVFAVSVSPDGASIGRVPTNTAPAYSYAFTVTNTGNATNTYAVSASLTTTNTTVTITGISTSSITLAAGASGTVTVSYTVADGTSDNIRLTATGTSASTDNGDVTVNVSKAAITLAKAAYSSMTSVTPLTNTAADAIVPGTTFFYKLSVTNTAGAADASKIVITDALPASLTYVSSAGDVAADWTITQAGSTVTATMTPAMTIAAGATRFIWVGVRISTVTTAR